MRQFPADIQLFKVKNGSTRKICDICPKLAIKRPERDQGGCSGVFSANLNRFRTLFWFPLLMLSKGTPAGMIYYKLF